MKDLVSEELERRLAEPVPWRSALLAALAVHAAVAVAIVLGPAGHRRPLTLPRVQVRIAPRLPAPPAVSATAGAAAPATEPRPIAKKAKTTPKAPARKAIASTRKVSPPAPTHPAVPAPTESGIPRGDGPATGNARAESGTVGLGGGSGDRATDEAFPYAYYLNRVLGMIESNWFRPPALADTRCRVLCRIDRSGRVTEVGLEEASGSAAFDRAALRAVYASVPFPPLPQGYGGSALTLHLEFGPQ